MTSTGDGKPGEWTREGGFVAYGLEICKYLQSGNWTRGWCGERQVPYAYAADQWIGYDDEASIDAKVRYVVDHCLGGAMVWSLDLDDFKGLCSTTTATTTTTGLINIAKIRILSDKSKN